MGRECKRLVNQILDMRLKTLIVVTATGVFLLFAGIYYKTSPVPRKSHGRIGAVFSSQDKESDKHPEDLIKDTIDLKLLDRKKVEGPKAVFSPERSLEALLLLAHVPPQNSIFQVNSMPEDSRLWPWVGNGHITTVVDSPVMYLNGVYSGLETSSHRAAIPALTSIQVSVAAPSVHTHTTFTLDTGQGTFNETTVGPFFSFTKLTYAHRIIKELFVVELRIRVHDHPSREALVLKLRARSAPRSDDIDFTRGDCDIPVVQCSYISGRVREAEFPDIKLPSVHVYWTDIPDNITMADGMMEETSLTYLMSISRDAATARRMFDDGLRINQRSPLRRSHMSEWASLWKQGSVDVEGDSFLAQASYASLYYMLSYLPLTVDATWPHSLLASGGLQQSGKEQRPGGHVTGDSERWVFPVMLLLHSNLSSSLLQYRLDTLTAARENANKLHHSGAFYPWETAFTGRDVVQKSINRNRFHVTGDIAVAVLQYMWLTKDAVFLSGEKVTKFVLAIAEFWESVLTADAPSGGGGGKEGSQQSYSIKDVRPPGRSSGGTVINSVYTNSVAKVSLRLPKLLLPSTYEPVVTKYETEAAGIQTLFDKTRQYLPAYQGYTNGTLKCRDEDAEVILRDVQFSDDVSETVRKNNLNIYGWCLSETDSPLLLSSFTTKYLAVKEGTHAERAFNRSLEYIKGPFKVWSEHSNGKRHVRFVPGMASFLHSVLYGFAGFRIEQHQLTFDPVFPRGVSKFTIHQLDYHGQPLTFVFDKLSTRIILVEPRQETVHLIVKELVTGKVHYFGSEHQVVLHPSSKGSVTRDWGLKINSI